MAESITRWVLSINCVDGVERPCGNSFYVPQAEAQSYNGAADDTARAATDIGAFVTAYMAMTEASLISVSVGKEVLTEPAPSFPVKTILRGNKLQFSVRANGRNHVFNVPARDAANYIQDAHSLDVSIVSPAAMTTFVSSYNALVLDADGNASTIRSSKVVD